MKFKNEITSVFLHFVVAVTFMPTDGENSVQ